MTGNRMSSLPIARFCGQSARLGAEVNTSGRAAVMSTTFHAMCDGSDPEDIQRKRAKLTRAERDEVDELVPPTDTQVGDVVLRWKDATHELEVCLTADGGVALEDAVTVGHLDGLWVVTIGEHKVAYVADIKKTKWTAADGPASLQLVAYGLAAAALFECTHYCCGIWDATEGEWQWGELVDMYSPQAMGDMEDVLAAAQNTSDEYALGPHCRGCYSRHRCPARLLPLELAETTFAPFVVEPKRPIAPEEVGQLFELFQRLGDTYDALKPMFEDYADKVGGIVNPKAPGKVWRAIMSKGRESIDVKSLEAFLGAEKVRPFRRRGASFASYRWVNKEKSK